MEEPELMTNEGRHVADHLCVLIHGNYQTKIPQLNVEYV